jgi:hypothetical protein
MTRSFIELLSDATEIPPTDLAWKWEVECIRPSEAFEAMESHHKQIIQIIEDRIASLEPSINNSYRLERINELDLLLSKIK